MIETRWTPGPWTPNGTAIEEFKTPSAVIGRAFNERDDCGIESESEALANAALMASAPELYEALRAALCQEIGWARKARAAMLKARGRLL